MTFVPPPTAEERARRLEGVDQVERRRHELIRGELVVSPEQSAAQREQVELLFRIVDAFVAAGKHGKVLRDPEVKLDPYDVLVPDICYVADDQAARERPLSDNDKPSLVVEVTAPELRRLDYVRKHAIYATSGIPEYWYVDPGARLLIAYELVGGRYEPIPQIEGKVASRVLPGLLIDVGGLFFGPSDHRLEPDR